MADVQSIRDPAEIIFGPEHRGEEMEPGAAMSSISQSNIYNKFIVKCIRAGPGESPVWP